jgi:hypothetical protein
MRARTIIIALLLASPLAGFAEGKDIASGLVSPTEEFPSAAGAFGSTLLGGGLSYQRWFGVFGFAVTAGGMAYPASGGSTYPAAAAVSGAGADFLVYDYNVQLDLLLRLYSSNFWNWLSGDLYAFATVAHKGSAGSEFVDEDGDITTLDDEYYRQSPYVPAVAIGVGIGYEIVLFRHFSVPLQFGYVAELPLYVGFSFSGGLRYRF